MGGRATAPSWSAAVARSAALRSARRRQRRHRSRSSRMRGLDRLFPCFTLLDSDDPCAWPQPWSRAISHTHAGPVRSEKAQQARCLCPTTWRDRCSISLYVRRGMSWMRRCIEERGAMETEIHRDRSRRLRADIRGGSCRLSQRPPPRPHAGCGRASSGDGSARL